MPKSGPENKIANFRGTLKQSYTLQGILSFFDVQIRDTVYFKQPELSEDNILDIFLAKLTSFLHSMQHTDQFCLTLA